MTVDAVDRLEGNSALVHADRGAGRADAGHAAAGLAVNLGAFALLRGGARHNIGIAGALVHVLSDLLGSVATIAAAGVILATGWTPIDPILSLAVAVLILRSGWQLLRRSGHILLEGTPEDVDPAEVPAPQQLWTASPRPITCMCGL